MLYIGSAFLYSVFCLPVAATSNIAGIFVGRFVTGVISAIPAVTTRLTIEDLFDTKSRMWAFFSWALVTNLGLALGPIYASYVSTSLNWYGLSPHITQKISLTSTTIVQALAILPRYHYRSGNWPANILHPRIPRLPSPQPQSRRHRISPRRPDPPDYLRPPSPLHLPAPNPSLHQPTHLPLISRHRFQHRPTLPLRRRLSHNLHPLRLDRPKNHFDLPLHHSRSPLQHPNSPPRPPHPPQISPHQRPPRPPLTPLRRRHRRPSASNRIMVVRMDDPWHPYPQHRLARLGHLSHRTRLRHKRTLNRPPSPPARIDFPKQHPRRRKRIHSPARRPRAPERSIPPLHDAHV